MTVEADLFNVIKGFVGNRAYPDVAPSAVVKPYAVFQQIGGRAVAFLERGLPSLKNGRFQVAVWSTTRTEAAAIALQIENALLTTTSFQTELIGAATADFDEDTLLCGTRQDFGIWSTR